MLDIPSVVKTRLKSDTVKKNFRVQFPNGEYNDITNENIVYESVRFSESICSQDTFRFGLAESSRIEFETVGIGNMLGMQIACFCEVDLTGENVNSLINWAGDGETVPLANSDLGYAFFRIPYGVFTVESCPRNHEAMTHRKVTAISTMFHNNSYMCPFEQKKTSAYWMYAKYYKPRVKEFVAENLAYYGGDAAKFLGFSNRTDLFTFSSLSSSQFLPMTYKFYNSSNQLVQTISVSGYNKHRELSQDGTIGGIYDYLLGFDLTGYDTATIYSHVKEELSSSIDYSKTTVTESGTTYSINLENADDAIVTLFGWFIYPQVLFSNYSVSGADGLRARIKNCYYFTETDKQAECIYPNLAGFDEPTFNRIRVLFPYDISFSFVTQVNGVTVTTNYSCSSSSSLSSVKGYRVNDVKYDQYFPDRVLRFNATLGPSVDEYSTQPRSFVNAFSFTKILEGYCEMCGLFLKNDRNGGVKLVSLKTVGYDMSGIEPAEYSEFWYDEYDVEPVTQIDYSYTVEGEYGEETQSDTYRISRDVGSVYDVTDNYVLQNMYGTTRNDILVIVNHSPLCDVVQEVSFTPVELTVRGYPQLEAGDRISVTTEDNVHVSTYILQCELDGIQNLQEYIKSEVGDPISIEGE